MMGESGKPSPKFKPLLANTLLIFGSVLFGVGMMEIGLRIAGISYPSFYDVDGDRGHQLIPNYSAEWTHEGRGYVSINQDGLRDEDHAIPKPLNTYRIAVLGDSFSEAIQVNAEDTYWSKLEQNLAQCPAFKNRPIEVINFGVGDYGTAQELMTLKKHVGKYQPDLVLLQIFTGNDIVNNSQALSPGDRLAPFLIQKDGQWVMDTSFNQTETYLRRDSWLRRLGFTLINHSRVLQVINEAKRAFSTRQGLVATGNPGTKNNPQALIPALDFDVNLYQEPQNKNWQSAWEATEALITLTYQEAKKHQAQFLAVTLSNPPQVYPDLTVRQELAKQGATNLFYPDERIAKLGKKENFAVLNLAPTFQAQADKNQTYFHGFQNTLMGIGHWNADGHQLAGKLIADYLCQNVKP